VKVLFVDQTGQLGGGELSLLDIARYSTFEREVVLFSEGPFRNALEMIPVTTHMLNSGGVESVRREAGASSVFKAIPGLISMCRELKTRARKFNILYANSQKAFILSALTRSRKQALVWHLRDMLTRDHFSPLILKLAVWFGNRRASIVIANSQATADAFVAQGGRKSKVVVVHNGISSAPFDEVTEQETAELRTSLGLAGCFVVGVFGRLTEWKGQHVVLEAVSTLPDAHAVFVGEALFGEQEYAESLSRRADQLGISDRIHFLGFRKDVARLMKMVNVVVHSSISPEPFGRVIVEGMLSERPVVATRAGGALEIIEDEKSGLLVAPGSSEELKIALEKLQTQKPLWDRLAKQGRERALSAFSISALVEGVEAAVRTAAKAMS